MSEIAESKDAQWVHASEHLYRAVVMSSSDAIVIFDRNERILDFSPSATELFGFEHGEILGRDFSELFPDRMRLEPVSGELAWIQHARLNAQRIHIAGRHKEGHELEVEVGAFCVCSDEDVIYCATIRNLAAEMATAEVEARRSLMQTLVADCASSLISKDEILEQSMGRIASFMNVSITRMIEVHGEGSGRVLISDELWASHEVEGERAEFTRCAWEALRCEEFLELMSKGAVLACESSENAMPSIRQLMQIGGIRSLLVLPVFASGRLDTLWTFEVHDDARSWAEYEIHLLESLRLAIARSIEREASDRELRSTWMQLREALRSAEDSARAKGEFIANVSHEIRTPMTAIVGYSDLLLRKYAHESQVQEWSSLIQRNGEHLLSLINDILDFSKIEAGCLRLSPCTIDVRETVETAVSTLHWASKKKRIPLHLAISEKVPAFAVCDALRLRQILVNFCSNAIKFTQSGQVDVRVDCEQIEGSENVRLILEVEDTGIGIAEDKLEQLFSSFTQVHGAQPEFGGTGLGLVISRHLARMMGGDVSVDSELGRGSTFRAELEVELAEDPSPPREDSEGEAAQQDEARRATKQLRHDLRGKRVLIVDDVEANRMLFKFILDEAGVDTAVAEDGEAALEALRSAEYDVVLMDMQMPVMDGYAATRALRARGSEIPIVALTASAMSEDAQRCFEAGCDAYLSKPVRPKVLLDAVAKTGDVPARVRVEDMREIAVAASSAAEARDAAPLFSDMPDKPAFRELLFSYLDALPGMLEIVETSFSEGDADELYAIAHKLTGSAGCYGYPQVSSLAGCLQTELSQGASLASVRDLVDQLTTLMRRVLAGAEILRQSGADS